MVRSRLDPFPTESQSVSALQSLATLCFPSDIQAWTGHRAFPGDGWIALCPILYMRKIMTSLVFQRLTLPPSFLNKWLLRHLIILPAHHVLFIPIKICKYLAC